ncbi:MAG: zinc-ribbon domain-containing protein [Acidobacteria bacterium]|nr:zinc-ribbon domain-containing protein [Acidobacteriota bacterium]
MPFCTQCGNQVRDTDRFCGVCGSVQGQEGGGAPPRTDPLNGLTSRNASLLCYIPMVGWIAAIVVLASARFRNDLDARFNAFQGLYLFVAWLIVDWVLSPVLTMPGYWGFHFMFPKLLKLAVFGVWIFMLMKVSQGHTFRLPILGELADRSVSEQH